MQDWPGAVTYELPINYAVFSKEAKRDPDLGFEFVEEVLCNLFEWMATKRGEWLDEPGISPTIVVACKKGMNRPPLGTGTQSPPPPHSPELA